MDKDGLKVYGGLSFEQLQANQEFRKSAQSLNTHWRRSIDTQNVSYHDYRAITIANAQDFLRFQCKSVAYDYLEHNTLERT